MSCYKYEILFLILFIFFLPSTCLLENEGTVYLVIGSDTAIWDGMSVGRYNCEYDLGLYNDPLQNAFKVMDPSFRAQFVDSYGQPLKLTWWMMAGNIFRFAKNKNVPIPNIMTLYLMKKYHGEHIVQNGDELSLHYHTFVWSDYDQDGIYYWNQALSFEECLADFNFTLAQFLLEENIFPVSFRSGWHYMDNDWQNYLNTLLPYSMHNDYPNVRSDMDEPLDNTYDWSEAPSSFIPYHPSEDNYQLPGDGPGWNVRSAHFFTTRYHDLMDSIFSQAYQGHNQLACLWGHLPEDDFLDNIAIIDSLAHKMVDRYPGVTFQYCTAIEAMQRWQNTTDFVAPHLTITEEQMGNSLYFTIGTDEATFQPFPFIAAQDIYEDYFVIPVHKLSQNEWRTSEPISAHQLVKIGFSVCDIMGNQSNKIINYLPDDIYIDNEDVGYNEIQGNWNLSPISSWGLNSRIATLDQLDTVRAIWKPELKHSCLYNIFIQIPDIENHAEILTYKIYSDTGFVTAKSFNGPITNKNWVYIATVYLDKDQENYLQLEAQGKNQTGKIAVADVAKFSALVRERDLMVQTNLLEFGEVSQKSSTVAQIHLSNSGYKDLTILDVISAHPNISISTNFPLIIPAMESVLIPVTFNASTLGVYCDTIVVYSNDPRNDTYPVLFSATVQPYFIVIDNEDSKNYREVGTWYYSNAEAYGSSSRYTYLNNGYNAVFFDTLDIDGVYDIFEIVPVTQNAADNAVYILSIANVVTDSVFINQNQGSGNWRKIGRYYLPANQKIEIKVEDTGYSTQGLVLRADAIKIALIEEITSLSEHKHTSRNVFHLAQNFPNPFNPSTTISYTLPKRIRVALKVYNIRGQEVITLVDGVQNPGDHSVQWFGEDNLGRKVSSGLYVCRLVAGKNVYTRKMAMIK